MPSEGSPNRCLEALLFTQAFIFTRSTPQRPLFYSAFM